MTVSVWDPRVGDGQENREILNLLLSQGGLAGAEITGGAGARRRSACAEK